jgi:hypothetical protein
MTLCDQLLLACAAEEAPKKRGRPKTAQPQEAEDQQQELSDSTSLVLAGMTQQFGELAQAGVYTHAL